MGQEPERIVLDLEGEESERGLALDNLEQFLTAVRQALRDFDRVRRLEHPRKAGHPEKRAEMVTAFRLLEFRPTGSNQVVIEPIAFEGGAESEASLDVDAPSLALENFAALLVAVYSSDPVDPDVTDALERARTALGPSGRIDVELPQRSHARPRRFRLDEKRLAAVRARREVTPPGPVNASGRLYAINLEKRTVGIRASASGIEWVCRYDSDLDEVVKRLLDTHVWAGGVGTASGRRGNMNIVEIAPLEEWEQSPLFTIEPIPLAELLAQQGVSRPQGIATLADPRLPDDDDEYERFLEAVLGPE